MDLRSGSSAGVFYLLALLLMSMAFNLILADRLAEQQDYQTIKTSQEYCDAKLGAIGYQPSTSGGNQAASEYYNVCLQIRNAEAAEAAVRYARWGALFAFVAAFAAGLAAIFTRKQARIAETAYRDLERPYVIERVGDVWFPLHSYQMDNPPYATLYLSNFGREPAILVQISAHIVVSQGPPGDRVLNPNKLANGNDILVSGGDGKRIIVKMLADEWLENRTDIFEHRREIWIAGEFWYRDIRGRNYPVPFEWVYSIPNKTFIKRAKPANKSKDHPMWKDHLPPSFKIDEVE